MPKIIKDLKPQIKKQALILFEEVGYDKVSMRKLASQVGIAVGTLYNYFSNKEELYLEILIESWHSTQVKLEDLIQAPYNHDQLKDAIEIIMDDISSRKGLGKEFFGSHLKINDIKNIDHKIGSIFKGIDQTFIGLLDALGSSDPQRFAFTLFSDLVTLMHAFPEEKDKNIEFLSTIR